MKRTTVITNFFSIRFFFVVVVFIQIVFRKLDATSGAFRSRWLWNRPRDVLSIDPIKNLVDILCAHAFRFMLGPIGSAAIGTG